MATKNSGFTMLELIMVVVIIATLASLAMPQYALFVEKARAAEVINYLGRIKEAQVAYAAANQSGNYAAMLSDLGMLTETQRWWYLTGTVVGLESMSFTAYALKKSNPYQYTAIVLVYNSDGSSAWGGSHPGTPGGPTV